MTTPDWLTQHDGSLRRGLKETVRLVMLGSEPQYRLTALPAAGEKHTCAVTQTVNGRRLDKGEVYGSVDEALQGGLETLRQALGW
jgi:hypothetical protein